MGKWQQPYFFLEKNPHVFISSESVIDGARELFHFGHKPCVWEPGHSCRGERHRPRGQGALLGLPARGPPPTRPSTVMTKPSGTHPRCPLPFLPSAGCRLGRREVPRFLGGAFGLSGAGGLDEAHWQGQSPNPSHRLVHSSPEGTPARALSGIFEMWLTRLCCQHDPPPCSHARAILSPPQSRLCSHPLRGTFAEHLI